MTKLDKDQVLQGFTQAYENVHGKKPDIQAKGGWYSVNGGKNVRLAQLNEQAAELATQDTDKTPSEQKVAAVKTTAKSVKKTKSSSFSVKQFWAEQLTQKSPDAVLPR